MDNIARIEYNGLEYSPEDYSATPGALSALVGAARSSRAPGLSAEPLPSVVMKLRDASHFLLLVHSDNGARHHVCYDPQVKVVYEYLPSEKTDVEIYRLQPLEQLGKVTTMGRVLVMIISGRLHYARLLETGKYQYLGERPKPIGVEVKTQANVLRSTRSDNLNIDLTEYYGKDTVIDAYENETHYMPDSEKRNDACNAIFGIINYYHDKITDDGCFHSPFFLRFAYRMYDGSHMGCTPPILIIPNTEGRPELYLTVNGDRVYAAFLFASLTINAYSLAVDERWEELITGVDVFASAPLYGYSDSNEAVGALQSAMSLLDEARCMSNVPWWAGSWKYGETLKTFSSSEYQFKSWIRRDYRFLGKYGHTYILFAEIGDGSTDNDFVCRWGDEQGNELPRISVDDVAYVYGITLPQNSKVYYADANFIGKKGRYIWWKRGKHIDSTQMYSKKYGQTTINMHARIGLKRIDGKKISDLVGEASGFYLLDELSLEEIAGSDLSPDGTRRVAPKFSADDLRTLATRRQLSASPLSDVQTPCDVRAIYSYNNRLHVVGDGVKFTEIPIVPYLRSMGANDVDLAYSGVAYDVISDKVRREYDRDSGVIKNPYFFHTSLNAKQLVVKLNTGYKRIDLRPHDTMGGSYAYDPNGLFTSEDSPTHPDGTTRATQSVYVSEVDNPWVYSASGTFSAGGERVLRLMSNTRALSEGQFGSHPLYAFTEGGVWALQPTSQGAYMSVQPISRDVCVNPDGIVGLDTALVFPSARGLMLLDGVSVQCISDALDAEAESLSRLPWAEDVLLDFGFEHSELDAAPLHSILSAAQIAYDYTHSRIIVFSESRRLALVYSLKTGLWSSVNSLGAYRAVPSYPEAYVQCRDGSIRDYTVAIPSPEDYPKTYDNRFYLVTRPFSIGQQDVHKTIAAAIQRGNFAAGNVRCVLYGSQNLKTWHVINSSTTHVLRGRSGTPHKHYRMLVFGRLNNGECLSGVDFDYKQRLQNKIR